MSNEEERKLIMRYGILSINIYEKDNNCGSVLQSWALQTFLFKNGIENVIVNYKSKVINKNYGRYPVLNSSIRHPKSFFINILNFRTYVNRDDKFKKFIKEKYIISEYCDEDSIGSLDIDGFIVGSDIVWHDEFWKGLEPVYFCDANGMKDKFNISYAPSLRYNGFTKQNEKELKRLLNNFRFISVREQSKVKYIKQFTNKNVVSVIDPTLLLDAEDYEAITSERLIPEKYVLVYCVFADRDLIEFAKKYAHENNYKLVEIECCSGKVYTKNARKYNSYGIEEWLSLIKYSEFNFTTSFHCCIFSILFKKKFYAKYSQFGSTKIVDLLSLFNLSNFGNECPKQIDDINYKEVYIKLNELKNESKNYILNAIKECEKYA